MNNLTDNSVEHLVYAAKALHIDGLGERTSALLNHHFKITRIWELLRYNYAGQMRYIPEFSEERVDQLYINLRQAVNQVYDYEIYDALMLPNCTREFWQDVCRDERIWDTPNSGINRYPKETVETILLQFPHHESAMMFKYFKPLRYRLVLADVQAT